MTTSTGSPSDSRVRSGANQDLDVLVIGGVYLDRISQAGSELMVDATHEVESIAEHLGGPGLCLALALSRLGTRVALRTAIGECPASDRAVRLLEKNGVMLEGKRFPGAVLDRAEIYLSPSGKRVVFNSHAISSTVSMPTTRIAELGPQIVVVASPTPVAVAETVAEAVHGRATTVLLLHSRQLNEIATGRIRVLELADVVCLSEAEPEAAYLRKLRRRGILVTTMGRDGATVSLPGAEPVRLSQPEAIDAANTNGAGEAFCAALISEILRERRGGRWKPQLDSICQAVEFAQKYAAAHIRMGANLAFPQGPIG